MLGRRWYLWVEHLILICGHYEGIDERVNNYVDEEISIGDYVLTGGEMPSMIMIDAISRLIPGVLNNEESAEKNGKKIDKKDENAMSKLSLKSKKKISQSNE